MLFRSHGSWFCSVSFEIRFQREPGENPLVGLVCRDMAGRLDLFLGTLPGDADGRGDLRQDGGFESCVLCEGISRHAFAMSIPLSIPACV